MVTDNRKIGWGLVLAASALGARLHAQGLPNLVFNLPAYTITFENSKLRSGWDSLDTPPAQWAGMANPPKVAFSLEGFAMMSCEPGTAQPNLDSLATSLAAQYGGHVTKGGDSAGTFGKYAFRWQEYNYDSLPGLSVVVSQAAGFPVSLKNGKIRVYSTLSEGQIFTVPVLPVKVLPVGAPNPFPDVEAALRTLVLRAGAGIRPIASGSGAGMWSRQGRLGGEKLRLHPPAAIESYDAAGAFQGLAVWESMGTWRLPVHGTSALRILMPDGSSWHYFVRP